VSAQKVSYGVKQSLRVWFDKFGTTVAQYDLKGVNDHSICVWHSFAGAIILHVYVKDIIVTIDE